MVDPAYGNCLPRHVTKTFTKVDPASYKAVCVAPREVKTVARSRQKVPA